MSTEIGVWLRARLGSARLTPRLFVALAVALFTIALFLPAFRTESRDHTSEAGGFEALVASGLLLLYIGPAIMIMATSVLSFAFGTDARALESFVQATAILFAALANPMFVTSCLVLWLRWQRTALVSSIVGVVGMTAAWWVVRNFQMAILTQPDPSRMRQPLTGYFMWYSAGVVVLVGATFESYVQRHLDLNNRGAASTPARKPN